ncbi:MAG TPA: twin-arginine translocation signal domain-containing protein, partial [Candidatus Binatia bacterium]|nr:twin-arginine translocation signal domain-containing protein [Candidatus Binatia bacterium]
MQDAERFLFEHQELTRRYFLRLAAGGAAAFGFWSLPAEAGPLEPELAKALENLEPYFTPRDKFRDVSRGKPLPHSLADEKKRQVGLTRATWKVQVVSDPDNPATIRRPLTLKDGTALDFAGLMQ